MTLTKEIVQKRFDELDEEGRLKYCADKRWIALAFSPRSKKIQVIFLIDYVYEFYTLEDFNSWLQDAFSYLFPMGKPVLSLDWLLDKWKANRVPHPLDLIWPLFEKYRLGTLKKEDITAHNDKYGYNFVYHEKGDFANECN